MASTNDLSKFKDGVNALFYKEINWQKVKLAFFEKMKYKGIEFKTIEQMINVDNDKLLKAAWQNSLGHQISKVLLPDYEMVKKDLVELLNKVFN